MTLTHLGRARFRKQALLHIRQRRLARDLREVVQALIRPTVSPAAHPPAAAPDRRVSASPAPVLSSQRGAS